MTPTDSATPASKKDESSPSVRARAISLVAVRDGPAASEPAEIPDGAPEGRHAAFNLRLLHPLLGWLRERRGHEAILDLALTLGVDPVQLDGGSVWLSPEQFEAALAFCRAQVDDDDAFIEVCAHRMAESYGPMRFVVRATNPGVLYKQAARNFHLVSRVSRIAVEARDRRSLEVTYTSDIPESRLMCLSRQAQMAAAPTLWGLPQGRLEERGCIANGDEACIYRIGLFEHRRPVPVLAGLIGGVSAGLLLPVVSGLTSVAVLAFLGGLIGYAYELARTNAANLKLGEEINETLRALAREEAEARLEIVALHKRQRQWAQLLEEQLNERTTAMQAMQEELERLGQERVHSLRGVSHDLNNPLQVLMSSTLFLAEDGADPAVIEDMDTAITRMRTLLQELMDRLSKEARAVPVRHSEIDVREMTEVLRRRMRALVLGRSIRVSVFRSREAPEAIRCDPLLMDRVLDNLLTNAAKYTESGSIVVDVGGTPGHLTIKVSDTGRGIDPYELGRIFEAGGSRPDRRAPNSFGVGLSVVVSLLERLGGRLEVMSALGEGTTFWAHFPVNAHTEPAAASQGDLAKVVTIRRSPER